MVSSLMMQDFFRVPANVVLVHKTKPETDLSIDKAETDSLGEAVESRKIDFAMGRICAREALGRLGATVVPVLRGPAREPIWPAGVCGSITHCEGFWAAAVAWKSDYLSIGLDAESIRKIEPSVVERITTVFDRYQTRGLGGNEPWELLLFSAKESVYKVWYPVMKTWLGFDQATVIFNPSEKSFIASINGLRGLDGRFPDRLEGTYSISASHIFTFSHLHSHEK